MDRAEQELQQQWYDNNSTYIKSLRDRIRELEAVVERLPTTADGVIVTLGMLVSWYQLATPPILPLVGTAVPILEIHRHCVVAGYDTSIGGHCEVVSWQCPYELLYSTPQAARDAVDGGA